MVIDPRVANDEIDRAIDETIQEHGAATKAGRMGPGISKAIRAKLESLGYSIVKVPKAE